MVTYFAGCLLLVSVACCIVLCMSIVRFTWFFVYMFVLDCDMYLCTSRMYVLMHLLDIFSLLSFSLLLC